MAKITERGKDASKTEELPAAELASLTQHSLAGSIGLKQAYSSFFQNLGISLHAVAVSHNQDVGLGEAVYSVLFGGEHNLISLPSESLAFFQRIISSQYEGEVAKIIGEYFVRKTCSVLAALESDQLKANSCSFEGLNSTVGKSKLNNWELVFRFDQSKFSLRIAAAAALHEFLSELSRAESS